MNSCSAAAVWPSLYFCHSPFTWPRCQLASFKYLSYVLPRHVILHYFLMTCAMLGTWFAGLGLFGGPFSWDRHLSGCQWTGDVDLLSGQSELKETSHALQATFCYTHLANAWYSLLCSTAQDCYALLYQSSIVYFSSKPVHADLYRFFLYCAFSWFMPIDTIFVLLIITPSVVYIWKTKFQLCVSACYINANCLSLISSSSYMVWKHHGDKRDYLSGWIKNSHTHILKSHTKW